MINKETVKKIKNEMLLTKKDFIKLLDVSFTTINRWEIDKYVQTNKARKSQPYFEKYNIVISE